MKQFFSAAPAFSFCFVFLPISASLNYLPTDALDKILYERYVKHDEACLIPIMLTNKDWKQAMTRYVGSFSALNIRDPRIQQHISGLSCRTRRLNNQQFITLHSDGYLVVDGDRISDLSMPLKYGICERLSERLTCSRRLLMMGKSFGLFIMGYMTAASFIGCQGVHLLLHVGLGFYCLLRALHHSRIFYTFSLSCESVESRIKLFSKLTDDHLIDRMNISMFLRAYAAFRFSMSIFSNVPSLTDQRDLLFVVSSLMPAMTVFNFLLLPFEKVCNMASYRSIGGMTLLSLLIDRFLF